MEQRLPLNNERGSVLIIGTLVLVVMSLLGISAIGTSTVEIQIAANERGYQETFYVADSGWKESAGWLNSQATPPDYVNIAGNIVKNFGTGGDLAGSPSNREALDFPEGTQDQLMPVIHGGGATTVTIDIPYWYENTYMFNEQSPGNDPDIKRFHYNVTSSADRSQDVTVRLRKEYDVGY